LADDAVFADVSPGGTRLLIIEPKRRTVTEMDENGSPRTRLEAKPDETITAAAYAAGKQTIAYAVSAADGGARVLRSAKPGSPPIVLFETSDHETKVEDLSSAARSPHLAVLTHCPAGMVLRLVPSAGYGKIRRVTLPQGVGTLGDFSRDGRVLTITWETPQGPSDIYEVATDSGRARKLRSDVRPALAALPDLRWRHVRIAGKQESLEATLYEPVTGPTRRPAVLLVGDTAAWRPNWQPSIRFLAGQGYTVIVPMQPWEQGPHPDSVALLNAWQDSLDAWLPRQTWWQTGARAVLARATASNALARASLSRSPAWVTILRPGPSSLAVPRDEHGAPVLISALDRRADDLVAQLRGTTIPLRYAVSSSRDGRLAREALFLEQALRPLAPAKDLADRN